MATVVVIIEGLGRAAQVVLDDATHVGVGTSTTAPTSSDTQLGTETNRKAVTKTFRQGKSIQIRAFFPNADLPATMDEAGLFLNGTGAADSGSMLVRGLSNFVKGTNDLTVIFQLELS